MSVRSSSAIPSELKDSWSSSVGTSVGQQQSIFSAVHLSITCSLTLFFWMMLRHKEAQIPHKMSVLCNYEISGRKKNDKRKSRRNIYFVVTESKHRSRTIFQIKNVFMPCMKACIHTQSMSDAKYGSDVHLLWMQSWCPKSKMTLNKISFGKAERMASVNIWLWNITMTVYLSMNNLHFYGFSLLDACAGTRWPAAWVAFTVAFPLSPLQKKTAVHSRKASGRFLESWTLTSLSITTK